MLIEWHIHPGKISMVGEDWEPHKECPRCTKASTCVCGKTKVFTAPSLINGLWHGLLVLGHQMAWPELDAKLFNICFYIQYGAIFRVQTEAFDLKQLIKKYCFLTQTILFTFLRPVLDSLNSAPKTFAVNVTLALGSVSPDQRGERGCDQSWAVGHLTIA